MTSVSKARITVRPNQAKPTLVVSRMIVNSGQAMDARDKRKLLE